MIGAQTLLALAALALITTIVGAVHIGGIARVLIIGQVAYWSLSYIARPFVLLWVQPRVGFADNIADPRLAVMGYDQGVADVMKPVVFGLWAYAVIVVGYALWHRNRTETGGVRPASPDLVATLATVFFLGMIGRAAAYLTGTAGSAGDVESANAILSFVAALAAVGALGLIIFLRLPNRRLTVAVIGGLLCVELLWTVAVQSKTPILSAAMAIAIRFALSGWSRARVIGIGVISVVGISAFGWLQSLKQSESARSASAIIDAQYPPTVQPFLSLLRRFDLLESATDAYYMAGREWLSSGQVVRYGVESLVPAQLLPGEKFHSGTAWASQVRGTSVDMTTVSVSLADGNINEGFVLGGYTGVIVGVLFTFGLLLFGVRALQSRHVMLMAVGLSITAAPVLFERGILGSMEVVGKSLQLAVLLWGIDLLVREFRRRSSRSADAIPGIHTWRLTPQPSERLSNAPE
jgi:hypothetical protein